MDRPVNVLLWFWGRDVSRYVIEMLRVVRAMPDLNIVLSCSYGSELHREASKITDLPILPVRTISGRRPTWRGKISASRGVLAAPVTMLRFHRFLKRHAIDVAVCAQATIWDAATIPFLARGSTRYIQVAHEIFSHPDEDYPLRELVAHWQLAIADGIVVLSEQIRQRVTAGHCPNNRCWKMPHGSYTYGPQTAAVHPRGKRPVRLLFFGHLRPHKGLDRLFAAAQLLRQRDIPFRLIIAGSGNLAGYKQHLGLPDVEVHNRWLEDGQVEDLLVASDLIVLPYNSASQSGVAAAAFGAGRPVVATPIDGLREQVPPSTGVLSQDMSDASFADALTSMITDPMLFDRCAAGALLHAQSESNWETCARILRGVIQQVCAMPRRYTETSRKVEAK